jgi:beta-glucosidase
MAPRSRFALRIAAVSLAGAALVYLGLCLALQPAERAVIFDEIPAEPFSESPSEDFLWGVATAAHQIEGGNLWNDWSRFEQEPGRIKGGERSGRAADHWNRVAEDVALIEALGAGAYRFSVEWSRVEPRQGSWSEDAWAHYADEVERLRSVGVIPMVTLLHFTLPAWLSERGGLTADDFPERFGRFAAEAARRLGPAVDLWCTVNEPNVQMYQGYVEGVWPPAIRDPAIAAQAFSGLVRGHAAAATALREQDPGAEIGAAVNLIVFDPASRWSLPDWIAARQADRGFNWAFYDSIVGGRILFELAGFPTIDEPLPSLAGSADFFGINYYRRNLVHFSPGAPGLVRLTPGPGPLSDSGVEIYPEGLLRLLRRVWKRYGLPIYVTENGIADAGDTLRADFIRSHAHALARALAEGIPVRGYFHWSLIDNFEWAEGFGPRFGLYRVDYETLQRRPTEGGEEFARLALKSRARAR